MDPLGLVQAGVNLLSSAGNLWSQVETNKQNMALQQKEWSREDNAVQRRVADLKAAGLNPVLAASGAGSPTSLAVRMNPPQVNAPDLSSIYAASLAKQQIGKSAAETAIASQEAELGGLNLKAQKTYAIPFTKAWNEGLISGYNMEIARAQAQKAVNDARIAAAEANIRERDDSLLAKEGVISNFGGNVGMNVGLMGANLIRKIGNALPK